MDDKNCRMHNVILGLDFGEKAGLLFDLTDKRVYYKDTFLMSAVDKPYRPDVHHVFGKEVQTSRNEGVGLPENDLSKIGEIHDEQEAAVSLIVRE